MDNYDLIQQLDREIRKVGCDAKAEALMSLALEKGLQPDDFTVSCDSLFYREYSKDVVFVETREDVHRLALLQLHLSRSGIYDHLPEGLFYKGTELRPKATAASDMALEYRQNKQKEQAIRRFFQPFENDFFWQRVAVEQEEAALLEGLRTGILSRYFQRFWDIPSSVPQPLASSLMVLLPYAHRIAGDLSLTAQSLGHLLGEPVRINRMTAPRTQMDPCCACVLGSHHLGLDMVCGKTFEEDYPVLLCTIGPLQQSEVGDYLEGGRRFDFLDTFFRFFLPAEVTIRVDIDVPEASRNMHLQAGSEPVLGYSSILGQDINVNNCQTI